jgi:LysM repeat protein
MAFAFSAAVLAALAADTWHTVQNGDSLERIARANGSTVQAIVQLNGLKDPNALTPGQKIRIPAARGADTYVVKAGDSLSTIAADHGVGALTLAGYNRIDNPNDLKAGQVIRIPKPGETASTPAPGRYSLSAAMKRRLDGIRVARGKWRYIVIHHSASASGSMKSMDAYHRYRRHMENGLAYHFVIGNGRGMGDGEIAVGNRWLKQIKGGHLASNRLNEMSIGICLVGNFETSRPTSQQLKSLYALVNDLETRCRTRSDAVKLHREINTRPTKCPGRYFPSKALRDST